MAGQGPSLRLDKSGLVVEDGALTKWDGTNRVARHELAGIERVELRRHADWTAIYLAIGAAGSAVCGKLFIDSPWISWTLFGIFGFLAFVFASIVPSQRLLVRTKHGEVIYDLADPRDHSTGFTIALKAEVEKASGFRASF